MTAVIIDNKLLDIHQDFNTGIITGLRKLIDRGINVGLADAATISDPVLQRIFELENIRFAALEENEYDQIFIISNNKNIKSAGKKVIVGKRAHYKTISDAVEFVLSQVRRAVLHRKTSETDIRIDLNLDGKGKYKIKSGIGFFDHMLEQISKHSYIDMNINVKGDLHVDEHHTVEDTGIAMGEAILQALGSKKGLKRFGYFLPMDDSNAQVAVDLGGRTYLNYKVKYTRNEVGDFPTELVAEFFKGLSQGLRANIYVRADGKNDHHKIEAQFKAIAKALNEAVRIDPRSNYSLPSTKGLL